MSAKRSRQFVDTNVIVYAFDVHAGAKNLRASQLLEDLWESKTGALSTQVLQEFFVVATRRIAEPLSTRSAARIVSLMGRWPTYAPKTNDILEAIALHDEAGISYWDALIIQSARRLGCPVVLSEDLNPGQTYRGVRVQNPF